MTRNSDTRRLAYSLGVLLVLFSSACVRTSQPSERDLGNHHVRVRPSCPSASTNPIRHSEKDGSRTIESYEFKCGNYTVLIQGNGLSVNGKTYGTLNENDAIAVNFGAVMVNSTVRAADR